MRVPPDHPLLSYSDYHTLSVDETRAAFSRPIIDRIGGGNVGAGARVRFCTDAAQVTVHLEHTARVNRPDAHNADGAVFIDGALRHTFSCARSWNTAQAIGCEITHPDAKPRVHDIVLPYGASVDVCGLTLSEGAELFVAPPREGPLYVTYGDSLAQGFYASSVAASWPFSLAHAKGWRCLNLGYAGHTIQPADGALIGALRPDVASVLIGYNNYFTQSDVDAFHAAAAGLLAGLRAGAPLCRIYVITPTWAQRDRLHPIPLSYYRMALEGAAAACNDAEIRVIDGQALADHNRIMFPDGTHPSDDGHAMIAKALAAVMEG